MADWQSEAAQLSARIRSDPRVQAAIAADPTAQFYLPKVGVGRGAESGFGGAVERILTGLGYDIPRELAISPTAFLPEGHPQASAARAASPVIVGGHPYRNQAIVAAGLVGGAVAAPYIAGALGASGAGGAAGTAATGTAAGTAAGTGAAAAGTGAAAAGTGAAAAGTTAATAGGVLPLITRYGPALMAGGKVASDVLASRAAGRAADEEANRQYTASGTNLYNAGLNGAQTELAQRIFLNNNYDRQVNNAVRGGYMQGVQDVSIERPAGVPTTRVSGGLRPSAFQGRQEIGAAMTKQAMEELLDPMQVASAPGPGTRRLPALPTLPTLPDRPEPGALDTGLGYAGYVGLASPLIAELIKSQNPTATTGPTPGGGLVDSFRGSPARKGRTGYFQP